MAIQASTQDPALGGRRPGTQSSEVTETNAHGDGAKPRESSMSGCRSSCSQPSPTASTRRSVSDCEGNVCCAFISVILLWLVSLVDNIEIRPSDQATGFSKKYPTLHQYLQPNSSWENLGILLGSCFCIIFEWILTLAARRGPQEQSRFPLWLRRWGQALTPDVFLAAETFFLASFTFLKGVIDNADVLWVMRVLTGIVQVGFFPGTLFLLDKHYSRKSLNGKIAILIIGIPLSFTFGEGISLWEPISSMNDVGAVKRLILCKGIVIGVMSIIFSFGVSWSKGYFQYTLVTCRSAERDASGSAAGARGPGTNPDRILPVSEITRTAGRRWKYTSMCLRTVMFLVATINIYNVPKFCNQLTKEHFTKWASLYVWTFAIATALCSIAAYFWWEKNCRPYLGAAAALSAATGLLFLTDPRSTPVLRLIALIFFAGGSYIPLLTFCQLLFEDQRLMESKARDVAIVLELGIGNLGCVLSDFMFADGIPENLGTWQTKALVSFNLATALGLMLQWLHEIWEICLDGYEPYFKRRNPNP